MGFHCLSLFCSLVAAGLIITPTISRHPMIQNFQKVAAKKVKLVAQQMWVRQRKMQAS